MPTCSAGDGRWPDGIPELAVWARAAEISLIHDGDEDGAEMAKRVLAAVPEFRGALLERWRRHLTDAHRAALGVPVAAGGNN